MLKRVEIDGLHRIDPPTQPPLEPAMNANRNTTRLFSAVASLAMTFTLLSSMLGLASHEQAASAGLLAQAPAAAWLA
ncbi:hypothetical protein GCM10009107_10270 [Ideonella azotifigens]|uniref:Uncharacterized protein n=2 Tax=Ideonella azotifigens TaxID=513160 RepID=A0ABN1JQE3_9BURK